MGEVQETTNKRPPVPHTTYLVSGGNCVEHQVIMIVAWHLSTHHCHNVLFLDHKTSSPRASSCIFSTVFQFRAVFTTPMPLSNFSANLLVPKPCGVCR